MIRMMKTRKNQLDGACGLRGEGKKKAIYGKLEGKTPLRKPSHIREGNIKN
jgi:hypothetical protein